MHIWLILTVLYCIQTNVSISTNIIHFFTTLCASLQPAPGCADTCKSFKCQFIIQEVHEIYIVKDGAEFPCTKDGDIEVGGLVIDVYFTGIPTPH